MKVILHPATGYENWSDDDPMKVLSFSDSGAEIKFIVSEAGSFTPTKSEAARACRRLANVIASSTYDPGGTNGEWPLVAVA